MSLFKKKLTEQEAASHFVLYITKEAQSAWPAIYKSLQDSFKDKFVVEDETMAAFDLALAAIAQDLQAVNNLFPKDQAERIEKWVLKCINTEDWGEYAVGEVKKYGERFQKDIQNINAGGDPLSAIPTRLLQQWLGKNIQGFDVEMNGKKTGIISPFLLMMVSSMLAAFLGTWKKLKDDFNLVEGDIPFDEKPSGLKDYVPEPDEKKPNGTIQYYDENGNLKEKWLPPEQINELLKKDGAKRLYKVLVKGHWDGVKEALWELSDDTAQKYVDENGYAYAICTYDTGELKYYFISRRLWEKQEQMGKILMDQNLSPEQQQEAVRKLMDD
ncbi:MAG: hypothetical protein NTZ10_02150 [Candidatus Saganbacteria bacterium]|nr:hypothetical protein [Candidatus Saganbacteria bacterium]